MSNLITFIKKVKYFIYYLLQPQIEIPASFRLLSRRDSDFQKFIIREFTPSSQDLVDLNDNLKIFGKYSDKYEISVDIFSNFDFSNKKLKPAFFNKADVKVPYEASRLQYLQKANAGSIDVNKFPLIYWNSPMDVAIRNINLIFQLTFIENSQKSGEILGNNIDLLTSYISQHYEFITNNLENKGNVVGNHYLIELTSLLLTIATFKFDNDIEEFQYYQNELLSQLSNQFYEDGTNFEGSSHYSAFVTEALIICKLAIEEIDINSDLIPKIDGIIKSNRFFLLKLINNDELSQIGDNDSGRLFYFKFDEDFPLKMTWLIDLIGSLYPDSVIEEEEDEKFNYEISSIPTSFEGFQKVTHKSIKVFTKDYKCYSFKDFGIYIWRNDQEYFSIRCGPIGQNGIGGHSHYDQLSIECFSDNKWIARDPGTGTYTDDIKIRNRFRSLEYHWGPKLKIKFPKENEFDCFKLNYMSDGEVLHFDKNKFLGFAEFNGKKVYRSISIMDGEVSIEDFSNEVELKEYTSWGEENGGVKVQFSNGYKRIS
jgi:hypothetical protein|tara:strand:- start:5908 stop:7524 length:1617 start_codon:yes stop_codon:yes gene_type:complete